MYNMEFPIMAQNMRALVRNIHRILGLVRFELSFKTHWLFFQAKCDIILRQQFYHPPRDLKWTEEYVQKSHAGFRFDQYSF